MKSSQPVKTEPQDARALAQLHREVLAELRQLRQELRTPKKQLLNVRETSAYLGIAEKTLRNSLGPRAAKRFPVRPVKVSGRVLFRLGDLDQFIDSLNRDPEEGAGR